MEKIVQARNFNKIGQKLITGKRNIGQVSNLKSETMLIYRDSSKWQSQLIKTMQNVLNLLNQINLI